MTMTHAPLSYVFLKYVPTSYEESKQRVFVLVNQDRGSLELFVRPGWEMGMEAEDRDYFAELMKDWSETPSEEIPSLLEQLAELSIGPLQAIESGNLDKKRRQRLINHVHSGRLECPANFVPAEDETNWYERSWGWHEGRSTQRSKS